MSELNPGQQLRLGAVFHHCFLEMFASLGIFPFTALTSNAPACHEAVSGYLEPQSWLQIPFLGGSAVEGSGRIPCAQSQWVLLKGWGTKDDDLGNLTHTW